jgi:hypothetical protein
MQDERWLPVPSYESIYAVSSLGRVRRDGAGQGATAGRILTPKKAPNGYLYVDLSKGDRKTRFGIHRLVAMAFISLPPFDGAEVNHKDTIKTNNVPENLEWMTTLENVRHAVANGLVGGKSMPGELNPRAKLSAVQVAEIRSLKGIVGQVRLAKQYGVSKSTIYWIHKGRNWASVL